MGVDELHNPDYANCLVKLTKNDYDRLRSLIENKAYKEVVDVMLKERIKLEQEIVCLMLQIENKKTQGL